MTEIGLTVGSWAVTLFLTFMIVTDVFLRFFFQNPLPATWEIGEICMPHIVFLPFAYALSKGIHVRIEMFSIRLSPGGQRYLRVFTNILSIIMCGMLTYYSFLAFWKSYIIDEEMLAAVRVLWWWGRVAMPIGMGMFTLVFILQTIGLVRGKPLR